MTREQATENLWRLVRGTAKRPTTVAALRETLKAGADVNARSRVGTTPLMWAACEHDGRFVGLLLRAGADLAVTDNRGRTVYDWARMSRRGRGMGNLLTALSQLAPA